MGLLQRCTPAYSTSRFRAHLLLGINGKCGQVTGSNTQAKCKSTALKATRKVLVPQCKVGYKVACSFLFQLVERGVDSKCGHLAAKHKLENLTQTHWQRFPFTFSFNYNHSFGRKWSWWAQVVHAVAPEKTPNARPLSVTRGIWWQKCMSVKCFSVSGTHRESRRHPGAHHPWDSDSRASLCVDQMERTPVPQWPHNPVRGVLQEGWRHRGQYQISPNF